MQENLNAKAKHGDQQRKNKIVEKLREKEHNKLKLKREENEVIVNKELSVIVDNIIL